MIEEVYETDICVIPTPKVSLYDVLNIYKFLCQECGQPEGRLKSIMLSQKSSDQYFVSCLFDDGNLSLCYYLRRC